MIASAVKRLRQGFGNYRNPFGLKLQQLFRRKLLTVTDRGTGLTFRYRREAHNLFGENFILRQYDVPLLSVRRGDVVVDVGANHGFFSCLSARRGARVYAFEPDPSLVTLLEENVARNGLTGSVVCQSAAVSGRNGKVELFLSDRLGGGTNTIIPAFAPGGGTGERITVRSVRLEDALPPATAPHIRLCKLDCEGAELEILRSLGPEFRSRVDGLVLELHPGWYNFGELVDVFDSWENFHVGVPDAFARGGCFIAYAVRADVVRARFQEIG
jgi:FkbM family methyltransferase